MHASARDSRQCCDPGRACLYTRHSTGCLCWTRHSHLLTLCGCCNHRSSYSSVLQQGQKKRKEKSMPFGVDVMYRAKTTVHHADWLQAGYQYMLAANPYVSCTTAMKLTVLTVNGQERKGTEESSAHTLAGHKHMTQAQLCQATEGLHWPHIMTCVHSFNTCTVSAIAWAQDTRHAEKGAGCDEDAPCALGCSPHHSEHWLAWHRSLEGGCRRPGAPALWR